MFLYLTLLVAYFADDKNNILIHENPVTASINLQSHFNLMADWYSKRRVKINHSKSVHATLTLRHGDWLNVFVFINSTLNPTSNTVKYY